MPVREIRKQHDIFSLYWRQSCTYLWLFSSYDGQPWQEIIDGDFCLPSRHLVRSGLGSATTLLCHNSKYLVVPHCQYEYLASIKLRQSSVSINGNSRINDGKGRKSLWKSIRIIHQLNETVDGYKSPQLCSTLSIIRQSLFRVSFNTYFHCWDSKTKINWEGKM